MNILQNNSEMPYERFLSCGAQSLTNAELLAIILRTGTKEKSATQLSREVLGFFEDGSSDLSSLRRLTLQDLISIPGIGEVKAVKILSLAEISRRLVRERAAQKLAGKTDDFIEGVGAFLQKRPAAFKGR